jgi:arylformamidase
VIVIDYPMLPEANFPIIIDSCQRAVQWIYEHQSDLNIDPTNISISGNSAGGHLVTLLMDRLWPVEKGLPADVISTGCAISGLYDLEPVRQSTKNKILCISEDDVRMYSPIHNVPSEAGELLFIVGGNETEEFLFQQLEISESWSAAGLKSFATVVPNRNHIDIVMDEFADNGSKINRMIRNLMISD